MAVIYFYEASDIDKQQLTDGLKNTDHYWKFIDDKITRENLDPETEVISPFVRSRVTKEMMEALPKLRLIACRSTGFNNIDLKAAADRNIVVTNVPSYGEQTVAEYTFALLLALTRKIIDASSFTQIRAGSQSLRGTDLAGKTIGVIGTGHIGLRVVRIARGFDMKVIAHDPYPKTQVANEFGMEYMTLKQLLSQSDIVTLHMPYMKATHHLLGKKELGYVKPGALIVNTARGEIIDTKALIEALASDKIGGAALDVLEGEALWHLDDNMALLNEDSVSRADSQHSIEQLALSKLPNVIITPHNAFNTIEAIERINSTTCQNIIRFWYNDIPNKVDTHVKEYGKLIIVRHAESVWNATGQWSGKRDVHLSEKGFREAADYGRLLKKLDITIDHAFCSEQHRTLETMEAMLDSAGQFNVPYDRSTAINERDYGDYTGMNKWEVCDKLGEEVFHKLRRSWDYPVPRGETLKMVYERVVPFYQKTILPHLQNGENVLLVAHGNSLRALIKYIEHLSDQQIGELEMLLGQVVTYEIDDKGAMVTKRIDQFDISSPHA
jgi:D-lactate dehydrogenase